MKWQVVLEPDVETKDWAVWCPELPGCNSAGATEEEALKNIQEAIALYIEPAPVKLLPGAIIREVVVG
jgi:predicted RNase H-like HicB family nuclease